MCVLISTVLVSKQVSKTLFLTQEIRIIHFQLQNKNIDKKNYSNSNKNDLRHSKMPEAKPKCLT